MNRFLISILCLLNLGISIAFADEAYQITNDTAWAEHPCWSPDSEYIAFESFRSGNRSIWTVESSGLEINPAQITDHAAEDMGPCWSPDGDEISFTSDRVANNADVWTINPTTLELTRMTINPNPDYFARYSFDGSMIAFVSPRVDNNEDIWIMPSDGGEATQLTSGNTVDLGPCWSPNGNTIAYFTADAKIWTIPVSGGNPTLLIEDGRYPSWSPDGLKIAFFSDRSGNDDIWVYSLIDSSFSQITDDPASDFNCAWSPDGTRIAFTSTRDGNDDVWVIEVTDSGILQKSEINIPQKTRLDSNYPNPFNPSTTIGLNLWEKTNVSLKIFDATGKFIKSLISDEREAGYHSVIWDGRDESGNSLNSGLYFYKLTTINYTSTGNAILLK